MSLMVRYWSRQGLAEGIAESALGQRLARKAEKQS
jgi:hypothetical protein